MKVQQPDEQSNSFIYVFLYLFHCDFSPYRCAANVLPRCGFLWSTSRRCPCSPSPLRLPPPPPSPPCTPPPPPSPPPSSQRCPRWSRQSCRSLRQAPAPPRPRRSPAAAGVRRQSAAGAAAGRSASSQLRQLVAGPVKLARSRPASQL